MGMKVRFVASMRCVGAKGNPCPHVSVYDADPSDVSLDTFRGNALEYFEEHGWHPAYDLCKTCAKLVAAEGRKGARRKAKATK